MIDAKYTELAAKYLAGEITSSERRELMEWVAESDSNQAFFDQMVHLWGLTGDAEETFEADVSGAWNKVAARIGGGGNTEVDPSIEAPREARIRSLSNKKYFLRIAAILLPILMVGAWWLLQPDDNQERLIVSNDSIREIVLPDSSRIWLNKESRLSYLENFRERKVKLVGEAYFEIARDTLHPFEIYSGQTVTRVLGTSFNIRAYPDEEKVEVDVSSGTVQFEELDDQEDAVVLKKGQAAYYSKVEEKVEVAESLGNNSVAWKNKVIDLPNGTIGELIDIMEKYFGKDIEVENQVLLQCDIILPGLKNPTLDETLMMVEELMSGLVTVDSSGQTILLKGNACR
ncbi:MAG: FecR domain-containing protein [Saprospiraceae bacterium]